MAVEFVNTSSVQLIQCNATDDMVAMSAWVSNAQDDVSKLEDRDRVAGLINFLIQNNHNSPTEHGQFTFKIHCPIFVAREFHRHRTQSYNEVSGRYTEMKPVFYIPPADRPLIQSGRIGQYNFVPGKDGDYEFYVDELQNGSIEDWERYQRLLDRGFANEVARQNLPLNLMTSFYATVNPRNLMAFLTLREDMQALYEIREQVAKPMGEIFAEKMPLTNNAYRTSVEQYKEFIEWKKNK